MDRGYRLRLLGSPQVEIEGGLVRDIESRKALALLSYLARQNQAVTRSHLAGLLWGDLPEARGRRNLSRELSQINACIPGAFQANYHSIYCLLSSHVWIDTLQFETLAAAALTTPALTTSDTLLPQEPAYAANAAGRFARGAIAGLNPAPLVEALQLYRGEFLAGLYLDGCPEFESWLLREREFWQRRVTDLLEQLICFYARRHDHDQAQAYARRWLELEPWHEEVHRYLMLLLARSGNRSAALVQYETCRRLLAQELAAEPSRETLLLYERIRSGELDEAPDSGPERQLVLLLDHAHPQSFNLPASLTSLIGRSAELAQIAAWLARPECRLLTLTGSGGIGKTRLALQAAANHAAVFADGTAFVALADVASAELLATTIAATLKLPCANLPAPQEQLLAYLRPRQMLLVLDNLEHLLDGVDLVVTMLEQAPQLRLLVTSRELLRLQVEWLLEIQGLEYPDAGLAQGTGLPARARPETYSAVQLFLARVRQVRPDFDPDFEDLAAVVEICRAVQGMPLAIELAASWARTLSCAQIAHEIEQSPDFLATTRHDLPTRQRSMRAVFEHSWHLLSPAEQTVLSQISVFQNGFTLAAAQAVLQGAEVQSRRVGERVEPGTSQTVLSTLAALLDKSLLRLNSRGRFEPHALLCRFAGEQLSAAERRMLQDRHSAYYLNSRCKRTN